jgi:glycerol-3-phosphate acyltransferase PlsX
MKIAVDAMGGDFAPGVVIDGAILAVKESGVDVVLVGDSSLISDEIKKRGLKNLPFSVIHAPQIVSMDDTASIVLRKKRDSSIRVAFELVKSKEAAAVVTAGNSGAAMVAGCSVLKKLPGIGRPAIAAPLPTANGYCLLLDAGANVDCKKSNLVQFAVMGSVYSKYTFGIENPRVALLSNGSEEIKGTELTKETNTLLKKTSLNYIGYAEGRDVYNGNCDVMICDGFIGNVVLKVSEGLADAFVGMVKEEVLKSSIAKVGALFMTSAMKKFKKRVDYAETGGAPLLGLGGVGIISHGGSSEKAIKNAILLAQKNIKTCINSHILEELEKNAHVFDEIKNSNSNTARK